MLKTCPFPVSRLLLVFTEGHHFLLNRWKAQTLTRKTIKCQLVHPLSCFCEASQLAMVLTRAHQDGTQVFVILVANVFCKVSQYFQFSCVLRAGPLVAISISTNPSASSFCRCRWGSILPLHVLYFNFLFTVALQEELVKCSPIHVPQTILRSISFSWKSENLRGYKVSESWSQYVC